MTSPVKIIKPALVEDEPLPDAIARLEIISIARLEIIAISRLEIIAIARLAFVSYCNMSNMGS